MCSWVVLGLLLLSTIIIGHNAANPFLPDVTTLHITQRKHTGGSYYLKRDPVETHMRTNALGLPLLSDQFGFIEPQNEQQDLLCWHHFTGKVKCNWNIGNFKWELKQAPSEFIQRRFWDGIFSTFITVFLAIPKSDCNNYYGIYHEQYYFQIYVLPLLGELVKPFAESKYITTDYHMIRREKESGSCIFNQKVKLYNCNFQGKATSIESLLFAEYCHEEQDFMINSSIPVLSVEVNNGRLKLWSGMPMDQLIVDIPDLSAMNNNSLNMIKMNMDSYYKRGSRSNQLIVYQLQELTSLSSNTKMTSVTITADREICLRVMFHTEDESDHDQVSLSAVDYLGQDYTLEIFHTNKSGYYSWKMQTSLPKEIEGKPIHLVLSTVTDSKLAIQRISSCNTEDKEQVAVISSDGVEKMEDITPKVYTFTDNFKVLDPYSYSCTNGGILAGDDCVCALGFSGTHCLKVMIKFSPTCTNGGVQTDAGCACPAGFTGPDCSKGCGPNRFGQDCGGVCSLDTRECEGMMLCTPAVGCLCAPGYRGPNCELKCTDYGVLGRYYGANCLQACGNCVGGMCNIYTGKCLLCEEGYYPPFCKEKYVHIIKPSVLSVPTYGAISVQVNFTKENIEGHGTPKFYQIQYKKSYEQWISKQIVTTKDFINNEGLTINIEALEDGEIYSVRVILIADDMVLYSGEDVPTSEITTKCDIPLDYNYNLTVSYISEQSYAKAVLQWKYDLQEHWCPIIKYEFYYKLGWKWVIEETKEPIFFLDELLFDVRVKFKVRAKTSGGYAPYSGILTSNTPYTGMYEVENLRKTSIKSDSSIIEWDPPQIVTKHPNINYSVTFKCVSLPSCSDDCIADTSSLQTLNTSVHISSLQPMAKYSVSVRADGGPEAVIFLGTLPSVPNETPLKSDNEAVSTNSSAIVFWESTKVCSGFFQNYYYELYQVGDLTKLIHSGRTKKTEAHFVNLTASTDYTVRVFVETGMGRNPSNYLAINISTNATVPEQVQKLAVYKRGRQMLGVRWAEPRMLYGVLESFTLSYTQGQSSSKKSVTIEPTRCVVWPDLYCYTIENLKPHQVYNIMVTSRNKEINEDGAPTIITALTKESSPGSPENLKVINVSSTTMNVQWDYPSLANGVLRSFLVSVEETEQYDEEVCCQDFPIIKVPVEEEQLHYELEVSGLHPASTYSISVSGRTIGFGPAQTLTAYTRPPTLALTLPTVEVNCNPIWTWLPQEKNSEVNTSEVYSALIKSRFVLVLFNNSQGEITWDNETGVLDKRLKALLDKQINCDYYIAVEYNEDETVDIGVGGEEIISDWGVTQDRELHENQTYQLAAIQVSEYGGLLNVDTVYSSPFVC